MRLKTVEFDFKVFDVTLFTFAEGPLAGASDRLVSLMPRALGGGGRIWGAGGEGLRTLLCFALFAGFGRV